MAPRRSSGKHGYVVAIAGDTLFVVADGLFFPSSETAEGTEPANELVAFRLGAAPAATPTAYAFFELIRNTSEAS